MSGIATHRSSHRAAVASFHSAPLADLLHAAADLVEQGRPHADVWQVDVENGSDDGDDSKWRVVVYSPSPWWEIDPCRHICCADASESGRPVPGS